MLIFPNEIHFCSRRNCFGIKNELARASLAVLINTEILDVALSIFSLLSQQIVWFIQCSLFHWHRQLTSQLGWCNAPTMPPPNNVSSSETITATHLQEMRAWNQKNAETFAGFWFTALRLADECMFAVIAVPLGWLVARESASDSSGQPAAWKSDARKKHCEQAWTAGWTFHVWEIPNMKIVLKSFSDRLQGKTNIRGSDRGEVSLFCLSLCATLMCWSTSESEACSWGQSMKQVTFRLRFHHAEACESSPNIL